MTTDPVKQQKRPPQTRAQKHRRNEQMVQLFRDGWTIERLVHLTRLTDSQVRNILRAWCPEDYAQASSGRGRPLSPKKQAELEAARDRSLAKERAASAEVEKNRAQVAEAEKRKRAIRDRLFSDPTLTLEDVGREFGITRERVRQIASTDPRYEARYGARYALTKKHRQEQERERKRATRRCKVCGGPIPGRATTYCSPEHRRIYLHHFRYHLDDQFRGQQKQAVARWVLDNPDKVEPTQIEFAHRVLAGEEIEPRGRWFDAGSKALEAALLAYRSDWPVFYELPPELQAQVKKIHQSWEED